MMMAGDINMTLEEEWNKIIDKNQSIYIYGAGTIGKKVLHLIEKTQGAVSKVNGFLVSDMIGNPSMIEKFPVMALECVSDRTSLILVSVTDIYQEAIVKSLKGMGFTNIIIAYKYSFMNDDTPPSFCSTMTIGTNELLLCQYKEGLFNRYDVIVRLLAVEQYYGKNSYGFDLYDKMQKLRINDVSYGKISSQRFIELIKSYEKNGYDGKTELIIDNKLQLLDGSHRLALSIYFGVPKLKARIVAREEVYYGKEWFLENFSRGECQKIEEKFLEVKTSWIKPIKGILWPSAAEFFDDIIETIRQQYAVSNIKDIVLTSDEFEENVYAVYRLDDIAEWKINTKLSYMKHFSEYRLRTFDIDFGNPQFRVRAAGGGILSDKGARLKEEIRERYKGRVKEYFPDIIFHTADNFLQTQYIQKLFSSKIQN